MVTPAQSRAARALLNWAQPELAAASGVSVSTIRDFEIGKRTPIGNNLAAIQRALEAAGVIFLAENGEGPGVRLRKPQLPLPLSGRAR
ncbi:helix-turn-helix domain-containing protein [Alsobacter sp. SYSU M60028]|uniref:Helix-turn-helix domain-containing protein n=1 Tax=Alsobacter ponti TaxID=2962936 RepID=A0ABT1LE66_9HYPH|nr:helix-turn-helix domain-containing protein [Alsobacter ponti]MCP8939388.1 helix-turn-helix domain-containing protein [Alsobacter ponti]